jgi:hypothetical protein
MPYSGARTLCEGASIATICAMPSPESCAWSCGPSKCKGQIQFDLSMKSTGTSQS